MGLGFYRPQAMCNIQDDTNGGVDLMQGLAFVAHINGLFVVSGPTVSIYIECMC